MKVAAARELVQNTSDRPATGQSLLKYVVLVFRKGRTTECLTLFEVAGRNLIPCRSYYGWLRLTLGGRCSLSLIHTQSFPSSCKRFANENWPELACLRETFPDRRRKHRDGRRPGSKLANHRLAGEVFFPCLDSFHGLDFVAINLDSQNHIKAVLRSVSTIYENRSLLAMEVENRLRPGADQSCINDRRRGRESYDAKLTKMPPQFTDSGSFRMQ
nr:hypothetical protein Iba_chr07aCG6350 [Ipomoea batatas]